VTEYSYAPGQLEVNDKINFAFVVFMAKNLAVECILDERDEDVTVKISRVQDGRKTTHYAVDENNVRVREDLFSLLRRKGVRAKLFRNVKQLDFHARIPVLLQDYAQMLRIYGQEILRDSSTALD